MVRLKVKKFYFVASTEKFQFHYGSIKSKLTRLAELEGFSFQFHYGSIKSLQEVFDESSNPGFQFHYGSIKSILRI